MPTNVKVKDLKINRLTEAQYDAAVQAGTIGENELSILTDMVEKTIQVDTMPTADASELDNIYQYVGETSQFYTNGYFYKCSGSAEKSATASQTEGSGLTNIAVDIDTFETQITTSGSYDFTYDDWKSSWMFHSSPVNLANYGITYTGTPADYDTITVIYSPGGGYVWNQINVQPVIDPLPDQTGQSGKFLTTDGTNTSWSNITKVNTTTTLMAADWISNTQTVSVTGITATGVVFVSPDPSDQADYTSAGILCRAQAAGTLTFTCDTKPSGDLSVNVVCL